MIHHNKDLLASLLDKVKQEIPRRRRSSQKTKTEYLLETDMKRIHEAESANIAYLGRVEDISGKQGNYCTYQITSCGHVVDLQATHVRRKSFKCYTCFESKILDDCSSTGLAEIGKDPVHSGRRLFATDCGHTVYLNPSNILDWNKESCSGCYEDKLRTEARSGEICDYIGKYPDCGTRRLYKFKSCGHLKKSVPRVVKEGAAVCRICQEIRYAEESQIHGAKYLGLSLSNNRLKRHYKLPCGCEKDLRTEHIKDGSWCCEFCEDNHYNKPSLIYLLKIQDKGLTWLKFGYAKNLKRRIAIYGLSKNAVVEEVFTKDVSTATLALRIEKKLHLLMKTFRLDKDLMKDYMTSNGHTECYDFSCVSLFSEILNKESYE